MITPSAPRPARWWRTTAMLAAATVIGVGVAGLLASPAEARAKAAVGYVRLAHLSPDTPNVDVFLSKVGDPAFKEQTFTGVGYGVVSQYLALPVGTYAVAMRLSHPSDKPKNPGDKELTTQVTVEDGGAYTVAGVGDNAVLALKVLTDDLSRPAPNQAKVRVVQASLNAPVLDVSLANGSPVAAGVRFATTTAYRVVAPGTWTLKVAPAGSSTATRLNVTLAAASVYSLLILDGPQGLRAELRLDASGPADAPAGGIETGAGGTEPTAAPVDPLVIVAGGVVVLAALLAIALRSRRLANQRP